MDAKLAAHAWRDCTAELHRDWRDGFRGWLGIHGEGACGSRIADFYGGKHDHQNGGGVLQLSGANVGILGDVALTAGTIEFQNADSLGTTAKTITISGTGDLATAAVANRNNITLNTGGTISANSTAANYTGTVTVPTGQTGTAALRQFQSASTANSFTIRGPLAGAGTLDVTAPAAATLTLSGNNSGFTGTIRRGPNATVAYNNQNSVSSPLTLNGGTISTRFANAAGAAPGLQATYYNFGFDPDVDANFANATRSEFGSDLLAVNPRAFSRIDPNINIPVSGSGTYPIVPVPGYQYGPNDGVLWKGFLNITNAGSYQFSVNNDDGATLFIDGVQIGSAGVVTGANLGAAVTLSAGAHNIVYKFGNATGGGGSVLRYAGPDQPTAGTIPASAFTQGGAAVALGPITGTGTLDIVQNSEASSLSVNNGGAFTTTSAGIDNLTITGATTLNGGTATFTTTPRG